MDSTVLDRPSLLLSQYACLKGLNFNLISHNSHKYLEFMFISVIINRCA